MPEEFNNILNSDIQALQVTLVKPGFFLNGFVCRMLVTQIKFNVVGLFALIQISGQIPQLPQKAGHDCLITCFRQ
jgi:hypothetical protein